MTHSTLLKLALKFAQQLNKDDDMSDKINSLMDMPESEVRKKMNEERGNFKQQLLDELTNKYPSIKNKIFEGTTTVSGNANTLTPEEEQILDNYEIRQNAFEEQLAAKYKKELEQEAEFDQQDEEIAQFQQKEKAEEQSRQKTVEGKTPFSQQDATTVINSFLPQMKTLLTNQKLLPTNVSFTFKYTVGISATNPKATSSLRKAFALPLELALKHYLISYKKYPNTNPLTVTVSL